MKQILILLISIIFIIIFLLLNEIRISNNLRKENIKKTNLIDSLNNEIELYKNGIDSVFSYYNEHDTLFSVEKLKYALKILNVKATKTVLAQFKLETGHFTSYSFKKRKNLGGYISNNTGQLRHFDHWLDCVIYTKAFQTRKYNPLKHTDYYDFLIKIGYAEGDSITGIHGYINYVKKLEEHE